MGIYFQIGAVEEQIRRLALSQHHHFSTRHPVDTGQDFFLQQGALRLRSGDRHQQVEAFIARILADTGKQAAVNIAIAVMGQTAEFATEQPSPGPRQVGNDHPAVLAVIMEV